MILYHGTAKENIALILASGLMANEIGIVYLSPTHALALRWGDTVLRVETGDCKLTAFEDCADWEILCWGAIPPDRLVILT